MVEYVVDGPADDAALNALFADAWPNHRNIDFDELISGSLFHVVAMEGDRIVGFLRVAGGSSHGMLFGPTVSPSVQGQGVGKALLNKAAEAAKERGLSTLHVEFAAELRPFYASAGFRHTAAGVRRL